MQVSIDTELLARIDRDAEALEKGRSAFIRSAVELYLAAKERHEVESRLETAYRDRAGAMLEEVVGLLGRQAWPSE